MILNRRNVISGLVSLPVCGLGAAISCQSHAEEENYGHFVGYPEGRIIEGRLELIKSFAFVDAKGITWRVIPPFTSDGASIPWYFWSLIGHPFDGQFFNASVVHDYFCDNRYPNADLVHRNFYSGLRAQGVKKELAWTLYRAVSWFGPSWKDPVISEECDAESEFFKPKKCVFNNLGNSGIKTKSQAINKENLQRFLDALRSEVSASYIEKLRQLPELRKILEN